MTGMYSMVVSLCLTALAAAESEGLEKRVQSEHAELTAQVQKLNEQLAAYLLHAAPRQSMGWPHSPPILANQGQVTLTLPSYMSHPCMQAPSTHHIAHTAN